MKRSFDLSTLDWQVSGWLPHYWRFSQSMELGAAAVAEKLPVPASVPGSVQQALLNAGRLPDWNAGLNGYQCEWVENRHWIFDTYLPEEMTAQATRLRLRCLGLDYSGCILINGHEIGAFEGTFVPHIFDLTTHVEPGRNRLSIVFECPPRWLGQFGYTSKISEWKARFNYFWDWTGRLVQAGAWDDITLEASDGDEIENLTCMTDVEGERRSGSLLIKGELTLFCGHHIEAMLSDGSRVLRSEEISPAAFASGVRWEDLPIAVWQPNGCGAQQLYTLHCRLFDSSGRLLDEITRRVGFKKVEWQRCDGAPDAADPWLCVVNGLRLFLQGVNWTPIRPNFADVSDRDYRLRLELYRDLGCNLLRVWGGGFLEKEIFYEICDELGLLVWQEFPLSSSGIDNWPPEDEKSIDELVEIARSYVARRRHHVSLVLWCGGNELQGADDGGKQGIGKPVDASHPLMVRWAELLAAEDPTRRFLPTSSSGPHFYANAEMFGQGVHWDVHGPWKPEGALAEEWASYWRDDDALFRSETGAPGASPADIILAYAGDCDAMPPNLDNPLWRRSSWWIEWDEFLAEIGREPADLDEYVDWSQQRQAAALVIAVTACKQRFPACGGILLWMGHDSFPCTANTAIIDFWGRPKPAALAVGEIFRRS